MRRDGSRKAVTVVKGWMVKEFKQTREYDCVFFSEACPMVREDD